MIVGTAALVVSGNTLFYYHNNDVKSYEGQDISTSEDKVNTEQAEINLSEIQKVANSAHETESSDSETQPHSLLMENAVGNNNVNYNETEESDSKTDTAGSGDIKNNVANHSTKAENANGNTEGVGEANVKHSKNILVPWFGEAENILKNGTVATVTDVDTGKTFKIKRVAGYNHADVETLTAEDTRILKELYGGQWSWERRAVIVNVNGIEMAASIAGMPHAGREDKPFGAIVSDRTGGYGRGENLDGVKGNDMSGVIDLHFYQSKTHGSNKVDPQHQNMVKKAANSRNK